MNFRAGVVQGKPDIQDKLYLGGPMDIRGYEQNTAGPKSGGTRLVGAGAHLYYRKFRIMQTVVVCVIFCVNSLLW